jgi:lipid-binding SYLF domain-containing protein
VGRSNGSSPLRSAWPLLVLACAAADATAQAAQPQQLVDRAAATLRTFLRDPDMAWLRANIATARGVLVAPEFIKAGFIIGGSGGRAVLLVREPSRNEWRGPAFYTLATGSVALQAGVASSETVTLVMSDKGVDALLASSLKLGSEASVAVGPVGAGVPSTPASDFVSFARSKGAPTAVSLAGTVITANNEWNTAYYGRAVLAPDVLVRGGAVNPNAAPLLATLTRPGS